MQVTLVGLGCGTQETITFEGRRALERAELILGAQRVLDALPENCTQNRVAAVRAQEIAAQLAGSAAQSAC
ncbi:MAG: cobalamin biosynthesis bifunctional protein CbiET, partial [Oscillospiraceae bacterium]|nr:cobalamin biosynthesis bifunctional protein CbiET [Oscillospiraceae bacterium]